MPRLLNFLPCRNVLINRDDNVPSAIGIITGLSLGLSQELPDPIPDDEGISLAWGIISTWLREEGDEGKEFEQEVRLILPNNRVGPKFTIDFHMNGKTYHTTMNITGFPLVPQGTVLLKSFWHEKGQDEWHEAGEYPIEVIYP